MLSISDLRITHGDRTLVSGIDLTVKPGETVGVVGESGSGKSITVRAATGLLPPGLTATGEVSYGGRDLLSLTERQWRRSIRGQEIGLIMQDPFTMLNPVMRCGDIIGESLGHRGSRRERRQEAVRRLAEVGIQDPAVADRYPFQLSGGMRQRVAIAAALARDPRVLIADEPSTALDMTTQRAILALMKRIQAARGMSLVLITHDLRVAFAMCDRVYVLYAGSVVEAADAADLDAEPLHPYSQALLLSEPRIDRRVGEIVAIPGSVSAPDEVAGGCVFAPRCTWTDHACRQGDPPLTEVARDRWSACVRLPEVRPHMAALRQRAAAQAPPVESPQPSAPVISVRDLSKTFGAFQALKDVSLQIGEGESIGVVGESGSGKTTLARVLVGLEQATSGTLTIAGVDVGDWAKLSRADLRRVRGTVQIVFQDPYSSLNPMRSIGWTLAEAVSTYAAKDVNVGAEVDRLLSSVGLPAAVAGQRPVALSGGMRQRVAIARALAARPKILICDESVSALDVSVQAQILNLLNGLRAEQGIGYLFITHDLSVVRQVTERIYVMRGGRVVESGATDLVIQSPTDPYTAELLASAPRPEPEWLDLPAAGEAAIRR
ncbi:ABC transporter ATP-binding protein [Nonomuraea sp. PA05]|uniref:dipeptide ABC transporter ATP-binding protein n=1 Tax=Nonomuraea sp. PA05 TaxID=2604466 RepID=UPI0011DC2F5E|nr:ABC transporter ATP-binding protein [Nonomuraea sp. PA05]TYB57424.1 ABC transporter ATP-binding protein [Nonomuraea sp. PA05]